METICFVYVSESKNIAAHEINSPSFSEHYMQGFKVGGSAYLTYRKDRIIKTFDSFEEAEQAVPEIVESIDLSLYDLKPKERKSKAGQRYTDGVYNPPDWSLNTEIAFTGFKKADKERLMNVAREAGLIVREDITVNLHILCTGYNAGPKKMEIARGKGALILNEEQFISLIETGEITA